MTSVLGAIGLTKDSIQFHSTTLDGLWTWSGEKCERFRSIVALQLGYIIIRKDKIPWANPKRIKAIFKECQWFSLSVPASRKSFFTRIERPNSTGLEENCKSKCSWQYEESWWVRGKAVQWISQWLLKREEKKYLWNNKEKQVHNLHPTI